MILKTTLAECPTDVLAWLCGSRPANRTLPSIAEALRATNAEAAKLSIVEVRTNVSRALRLLKDLGLADWVAGPSGDVWSATTEGRRLIEDAIRSTPLTPKGKR